LFGIGWLEFLVIVAVAVLVIGPKDLPHALYSAGKFIRKIRRLTAEFQKSVDSVMAEGELDEIVREANKPGGENLQFEIERQIEAENRKNGTTG
jgi:sec-independent protein translocase protein TatB